MSCDRFLGEHERGDTCDDPRHQAALERRRGGAPHWSPIVRGSDAGGRRDFLDGRPIHCGTALELQALEWHADDFGEFTLPLPTGVPVRYEMGWSPSGERSIELYTHAGSYTFKAEHEPWMRFRWPERHRPVDVVRDWRSE